MRTVLVLVLCAASLRTNAATEQPFGLDALEGMQQLLTELAGHPAPGEEPAASHMHARNLLSSGSTGRRGLLLQVPSGIVNLMRGQDVPPHLARLFSPAASSSQHGASAPPPALSLNLTLRTGTGQVGGIQSQAGGQGNQTVDLAARARQEAIDQALLSVINNGLGLTSSISYSVAGALSILASGLNIIVAEWARLSGRINYGISAYSFRQERCCEGRGGDVGRAFKDALYSNFNAQIEGSDYLGDAAKYIKLWNKLQAELSTGQMATDLQGQMAQLSGSKSMLDALMNSIAAASPT